jgi:phosphoribosylformylglycinamidine (FGAM) synthase PurS component
VKPQGNVIHTPLVTQNFVVPKNNVVKTPTFTQNFVKGGTLDPKGSNGPTVTQNFLKGGGTLNSKGSNTPSITLNNVVKPGTLDPKGTTVTLNTVKPGTLDPKGTTVTTLNTIKPGTLDPKGTTVTTLNNALKPGTLTTSKTTLTTQNLATTLKTMIGKSATQSQLTALEKALQTKNVKAPVIKDLNLSNADIQLLLNLVSADVTAGDTSAQIITDIATLFNSFGNNNNHNNNNEDENNDDDSDENNENNTSPAPILTYPYSFIPGYNFSYVPGTYNYSYVPSSQSSMYVDGFGPVAVESVQLSNGQTVQIPAPPYNQSMTWGSFGTYANWAAQFQAQNGRAPTDQDLINFWISQALAGQLRISPTP